MSCTWCQGQSQGRSDLIECGQFVVPLEIELPMRSSNCTLCAYRLSEAALIFHQLLWSTNSSPTLLENKYRRLLISQLLWYHVATVFYFKCGSRVLFLAQRHPAYFRLFVTFHQWCHIPGSPPIHSACNKHKLGECLGTRLANVHTVFNVYLLGDLYLLSQTLERTTHNTVEPLYDGERRAKLYCPL